jgi:APA family basic amino acid/polyamine antiporter
METCAERGTSVGLARVLGLGDLIGIVVGSVIGAGIFLVPASIATALPSPALVLAVWMVGALLSFFGALCVAELGALFPRAGGIYVYLREAYGPLPAFLYGWTLFLVVDSGTIAALAAAFASKYLPHFVTLSPLSTNVVLVAFVAVLVAVNVAGVRAGANLQNALTAIKVLAIVAVVVAVFVFAEGDARNYSTPAPEPFSAGLVSRFGVALIACLWAYKGWETATFTTGELRRPQRSLFLGLAIGSLSVAALYLLANLAYLFVLPTSAIATTPRIAAEALTLAIGPAAGSLVAALILLSIMGSANASLLASPRVTFAMAGDGLFFRQLHKVHPRLGTPYVAIAALGVWSALLALTGTFEELLAYVIFGQWLFLALTAGAVVVLRRRRPDLERPVRVWGYPFTPVLFMLVALAITVSSVLAEPRKAVFGLGLAALGVPVYLFWRRRQTGAATGGKT